MELALRLPIHLLHYHVVPHLGPGDLAGVIHKHPEYAEFLKRNPGCFRETKGCLHWAAENGLAAWAPPVSCGKGCRIRAMRHAVSTGDLDAALQLCQRGCSMRSVSLKILAAENGHLHVMRRLRGRWSDATLERVRDVAIERKDMAMLNWVELEKHIGDTDDDKFYRRWRRDVVRLGVQERDIVQAARKKWPSHLVFRLFFERIGVDVADRCGPYTPPSFYPPHLHLPPDWGCSQEGRIDIRVYAEYEGYSDMRRWLSMFNS